MDTSRHDVNVENSGCNFLSWAQTNTWKTWNILITYKYEKEPKHLSYL